MDIEGIIRLMKSRQLVRIAWGLSLLVTGLAFLVWYETFNGRLRITALSFFPLLGLVAFSLMWTHYVVGALRRYFNKPKASFMRYYNVTAAVVLIAILLHPGLLIYRLWRGGLGLPPGSYLQYVVPPAKWAVLLGSISLLIFLLFELHHKYGEKSWWKWMELAQVVAMIAVFFHALRLGGELRVEWYRRVWIFYGVSLLMSVCYTYYYDHKHLKEKK